jgi:hypothetical protein
MWGEARVPTCSISFFLLDVGRVLNAMVKHVVEIREVRKFNLLNENKS